MYIYDTIYRTRETVNFLEDIHTMKRDLSIVKSIIGKNYTKRNRFTRQCIGESVIALLHNKDFEDITVSDIVKKAGVSRMTFYHYFHSSTDALNNYLHEIIQAYLEECSRSVGTESFDDQIHIRHAFLFFDQYADCFLTLAKSSLHSLMIHAFNDYIVRQIAPVYPRSSYELYFYCGALLNVFLEWEANGKQESVDDIVSVVCSCCHIQKKDG